ncbi:MAG: hypothetical protein WAK17_25955 [Candidatus Nitrosopolaris sp.]|jgi:hypothetical protein
MNLFNQDRRNNLLHKDGMANVPTHNESNHYFDLLLQKIVWENEAIISKQGRVYRPYE